jgi:hypothetical protein
VRPCAIVGLVAGTNGWIRAPVGPTAPSPDTASARQPATGAAHTVQVIDLAAQTDRVRSSWGGPSGLMVRGGLLRRLHHSVGRIGASEGVTLTDDTQLPVVYDSPSEKRKRGPGGAVADVVTLPA